VQRMQNMLAAAMHANDDDIGHGQQSVFNANK
jgi:hypothetical protein